MHDIVLIQLGPNILEGNITKSGQADLYKRAIDDHIIRRGARRTLVAREYTDLGEHGPTTTLGGRAPSPFGSRGDFPSP